MNCDRYTHFKPEWCPGCGNFDILDCVKQALCELEIENHQVIVVAGIGQTSKMCFSVKTNVFDGLHGRSLPVALGVKMANHQARVLAISGDGDFYGEGGNHFIHAMRRNLDVTILAGDNRVYGLTKGQASPTSTIDFKSKIHREGTGSQPIRPAMLALASGATFIAKGFSGDKEQLTDLIKRGIQHRGAALVDIMFPCVTFNRVNTFAWYKERVTPIDQEHDPTDFEAAMALTMYSEEAIPTGVFYQIERPVFGDHLTALKAQSIVERTLSYTPDRVRALFDSYR
jgi:2-oxoglutarate ferredoxin oxidoreductase subunit beta